jgi:phosphoglycolate phosphatase-like HAD superfamily hydrolase
VRAAKPAGSLIVFDLDGVITTEHIYWECARLTVWEVLWSLWRPEARADLTVHDPAVRESVIPQELVFAIKNRAVNSNWDLTYLIVCALVGALPTRLGEGAETAADVLERIRSADAALTRWPEPVAELLSATLNQTGRELLETVGRRSAAHLAVKDDLLCPEGPVWQYLYARFQQWYDGTLMSFHGAARLAERPVLAPDTLRSALIRVQVLGYRLGVATGRPLAEAAHALQSFGVLDLFDVAHIATHDDVLAAQEEMGLRALGKPHPFVIRRALWPQAKLAALIDGTDLKAMDRALVVGDSVSDAQAATAAGVPCVAVLSGVSGRAAQCERAAALQQAGCVAVLDDLRDLPDWLAAQRGRGDVRIGDSTAS